MNKRVITFFLISLVFYMAPLGAAQREVTVGIVTDGPSIHIDRAIDLINNEIQSITEGEFDVKLPKDKQFNGGWQRKGIDSAFARLYADKDVDILIALGFGAASVAVNLNRHPKPTLAAVIIDDRLSSAPRDGNTSGKHNLNYISIQADLKADVETFRRVVDFKNLALLSDALIPEVMPGIVEAGKKVAQELDVKISHVPHHGGGEDLVAQIPADVDAVLIGALPRLDEAETKAMLDKLAVRGLPSYQPAGIFSGRARCSGNRDTGAKLATARSSASPKSASCAVR